MPTIAEQLTVSDADFARIGKLNMEISRAKELREKMHQRQKRQSEEAQRAAAEPIQKKYQGKKSEIDAFIAEKEAELEALENPEEPEDV